MALTLKRDNPIRQRMAQLNRRVHQAQADQLYLYQQPATSTDGVYTIIEGRKLLQLAAYDYLNLAGHPTIQAAAQAALSEFGTGTPGVRLLSGTNRLHIELEQTIARFKQTEAAVVFSSGYVTNFGVIAALVGRDDVVLSDKLNHASIVDGCLNAQAKFVRFKHNDMADLARRLAKLPSDAGKLVVVDAVFSMDGDVIDLPQLIAVCREYDALLMVDEAHALGVLGECGRGLLEHFGLTEGIDVQMGTLSKAIPSVGGYVAGDEALITYLKHAARPFIFSAALPPPATAAAQAALAVIQAEPERVARLQANSRYFIQQLQQRGFNTLNTETPIIPVIFGSDACAQQVAQQLQQQGLFVLPIVPPAVPDGTSRLRINVSAGLSQAHIDHAVACIDQAAQAIRQSNSPHFNEAI